MKALMRLGAGVLLVLLAGCVTQPEQRAPAPTIPPPTPSAPPVTPVPAGPREGETPRTPSPLAAPATGGVAYYQERQEQQLRERIQGSNIRVLRNGDTIRLVLPGNTAFAANGDQLQPRFAEHLTAVAAVLKEYRKTTVDIRGYTDSTGSFEHNQQLSARRAQAVGSFLTGKQVAAARIRTAGYGPRYPVADNKTDAGRLQNRRIEIDLVPTP